MYMQTKHCIRESLGMLKALGSFWAFDRLRKNKIKVPGPAVLGEITKPPFTLNSP